MVFAQLNPNIKFIISLLEKGVELQEKDVSWENQNHHTLLHIAVLAGVKNKALTESLGNNELLKRLLKMGAKVDAKDVNGSTPLHLAAMTGNTGAC